MGVKNAFLGRLLASSDTFSDDQVAQTISLLVEHAVEHQASDIHIEPRERFVQVRYRVDNVLQSVHKLPLAALPAVVAQLKDQANLKDGQAPVPQEGQYAVLVGEEQFEIQVYTMPVIGGEKVVLHLSKRLRQPPTLEALGFWGDALASLRQILAGTHGLVIVATPRRNGKTTTLHSMLHMVTTPAVSVATIEDTLEFRIPGANQSIITNKHLIADHFQAALNQDPNVIMISSLPDSQTAQSAVQAAVSGHLVLAGLHADNASRAIAQLQLMSNEQFLFANALSATISQRLVRRLCPKCSIYYTPDREEIRSLEKAFGITSETIKQKVHHLEKQAIHEGLGDTTPSTTSLGIANLWRASEDGCAACNHTGYQGSIAVVEVLRTQDNETERILFAPASADKIRRVALKEGFIPLELDGLVKALRGQTTITELLQVLSI